MVRSSQFGVWEGEAGGESDAVLVEAFISNHSTFTVECPTCHRTEGFPLRDLPHNHPNPFQCQCPCGAHFLVQLVGFRAGRRKPVRLAASFTRRADARPIRRFATVLDLSIKGMRLSTEYSKNLRVNDEVTVSLVLDDGTRTKLDLSASVRRITPEQDRGTVAVEFHPICADTANILRAYLGS